MIKLIVAGKDITDYAEKITWSGNMDSCVRTLKVDLVELLPEVGDTVTLFYGSTKLFAGKVMYADIDTDREVSIEASDYGVYLANNYTYKEYKGTPAAITKKVCSEFGIKIGKLPAISATTKVTSTGDLSAFRVIERAYEGEDGDPKKQYLIRVAPDKKLYIEKVGSVNVGSIRYSIEEASRSESIKNMVNRVTILNDKGTKKTGEVQNAADRKKYGTFQKTYRKQKDKKAAVEAKKLLKPVELGGSVAVLGNPALIAGRAVIIVEAITHLTGRQIIQSDTHTWSGGDYTTKLEFYYEQ